MRTEKEILDDFEQRHVYSLKDYGKSWALTKEELEGEK